MWEFRLRMAIHQKDVDIIDAPRSTGSILKPLLICWYARLMASCLPEYVSGRYSNTNFRLYATEFQPYFRRSCSCTSGVVTVFEYSGGIDVAGFWSQ